MFGIEQTVARTARKAAFVTASAVLTMVGTAFFTAAAWMYLSADHSAIFAATVIGLVYSGAGMIMLALSLANPRRGAPLVSDLGGLSPAQLMVMSFLQGLDQGKKAKRSF